MLINMKSKNMSIKLPKGLEYKGLVWDIENSSFNIDSWDIYNTDAIYINEYPKVLTIAWHWIGNNKPDGEPRVHVVGQDDFRGYKAGVNDDEAIVKFGWNLLSACDFAVAHNGDKHDVPILQNRMAIHKLMPPEPFRLVDTKKMAKRVGKFGSNSLKHLALQMGHHQKGDPGGYGTWQGCVAGDKKAWKTMKSYNKLDIPPLLDLYLDFRPWDKQAVPLNVLLHRPDACPKCGKSGTMIAGMKYASTKTGQRQYFRCKECGGMSTARLTEYKQSEDRMSYIS